MKIIGNIFIEQMEHHTGVLEILYHYTLGIMTIWIGAQDFYLLSKEEIIENSDKWNNYVIKNYLSEEVKLKVENFIKRLDNIIVFS